jgi:hypothetical protein
MSTVAARRFKGMKGCRAIYTLALVALIFLQNPDSAMPASGPRMVLEGSGYDAKEVKEGAVISHSVRVLNRGDQVLNIRDVNSD